MKMDNLLKIFLQHKVQAKIPRYYLFLVTIKHFHLNEEW